MNRAIKARLLLCITLIVIVVFGVTAYDLTQERIVYEVAGAHLDTQWQWDLAMTVNQYLPNTLLTNFAYFDQYPEYKFNFEGAFRYWLVKNKYPTYFATLKSYVAKNRWCLAGGGAEPGDVNIPSPEALIRNYLYGDQFFKDEFNKKSIDVYLPDCFGFGYALPTIASHCGMIGFSTQKFDLWGGYFPTPFPIGNWIGVDGSSLVATLKPGSYASGMEINTTDGDWLKANSGAPGIWATYDYIGTGDVGGGPSAGNVSAMIDRIRSNSSSVDKVYCTSSDQLYRDLTPAMIASLPSYTGELLLSTHSTGCYSAWAEMKYKNRKNEQRAMLAEFADVTANWLTSGSFAYPQDTLWRAWWRVIDCQFHDVLTGTSIPTVYTLFALPMEDSSFNDFTYALGLGNNVMGQQLTTTVTEPGRVPLVLVNALARPRCDIVEATVNLGASAPVGIKVYGPDSVEVPSQITGFFGQNVSIAFVAHMPSASYCVYEVKPMATANPVDPNLKISAAASGSTLENAFYSVSVNALGDIADILDKKTNQHLFSVGASSRFELRNDQGTSFPAWEIRWLDISAPPTGYVDQNVAMSVQENGPARVSLKIVRTKNGSSFTQFIMLASDSAGNRIDVKNTVTWQTTGTLLKVAFPLSCANRVATWDLGLGTIFRGNMFYNTTTNKGLYEVPGQQWADLTSTDGTYGVSILNDCKYGWSKPSDGVLALTLFHSPSGGGFNYQGDQSSVPVIGDHTFTYSIYGHAGNWRNGTVDQGERLNQPIYSFQPASQQQGKIGKTISFVKTSSPQVAVMAIKKAEKSSQYVVRVRETQGTAIDGAKLIFPNATILAASEVNGIEEPKAAAAFSGGDLTFDLTKYQPKTFSVQLGVAYGDNRAISGHMQNKPAYTTLTVVLGSSKTGIARLGVPYGAKIRSLSITNALGRVVRKLSDGQSIKQDLTISWDGKDDNSRHVQVGLYFVHCVTDIGSSTGKLPVAQ